MTKLGAGVDGSVRAIGANFNTQGLPFQQTSYADSSGTTVANQVQDVYNGLGQLTGEYQSHAGAVNTSTTLEVQYAFSDPSLGSRMTSMTYPNGRVLSYLYNTGIDATIGRVSALADAGGSAAGIDQSYAYQGLSTIVGNTDGNGVTETTTLDAFGRTAEMKCVNASSVTTDDFAYGYDRDGNVLYKNNLLNSSESELYHATSTSSGDNNIAYDPLNRLTGFSRGTLSSSGNNGAALDTVASPSATQSWSLDAVGNQSSVATNGTAVTRTNNAKNELTGVGSSTLTFDNNGKTTTDESGQTYTYDAWNRSITVKNSGGTTIASYSYDPQGWRITEASAGTTTDLYFTNQWQAIEERQAGTVTRQNVWGEGYVNQLIERDDNSASGTLGLSGSGLGRRLYVQQDANWNVTSLVDASGTVSERMVYLPYGVVTFLTSTWTLTSDAYGQKVLFQGGTVAPANGDYSFDNRDYRPSTGTWEEPDPKGYLEGADLFQGFRSTPERFHDPLGTDCRDCRCPGGGYFHPRTRVTDGPSGEKVAEKLRDLALKAFGEINGLASTLYATAAQGLTDLDHNDYYYAVITTCKESDGHRVAGTEPLVFSFQCPGVGPSHVQPGDGFTDQDPDAYERSMSICNKLAAAAFNRWIDGLAEFKERRQGEREGRMPKSGRLPSYQRFQTGEAMVRIAICPNPKVLYSLGAIVVVALGGLWFRTRTSQSGTPTSQGAANPMIQLLSGLERLRERCPPTDVGEFERRSLTGLIATAASPKFTESSVCGVVIAAVGVSAWWLKQPGVVELDILYLESPNSCGNIYIVDAAGKRLFEIPFRRSSGSPLSPAVAYYNRKALLQPDGRLLSPDGSTYNNRLEPPLPASRETLMSRVVGLQAYLVELGGKSSDVVPILIDAP